MKIGELIRRALHQKTDEEVWVRVDGVQFPVFGFYSEAKSNGLILEIDQGLFDIVKTARAPKPIKGKKNEQKNN